MKSRKFAICLITLLPLIGCGKLSGGPPEVPLDKPTDVQYSYTGADEAGKERVYKQHLLVSCTLEREDFLKITITPKGEYGFGGEGFAFYQIDKEGNTVSASSADLQVHGASMVGMRRVPWTDSHFGVEVGDTQTGYLRIRPRVVRIDYRPGDDHKTMFSMSVILEK